MNLFFAKVLYSSVDNDLMDLCLLIATSWEQADEIAKTYHPNAKQINVHLVDTRGDTSLATLLQKVPVERKEITFDDVLEKMDNLHTDCRHLLKESEQEEMAEGTAHVIHMLELMKFSHEKKEDQST